MPLSFEKSPRSISRPGGSCSRERKDSNHGCTLTARANLKRAPKLPSSFLHALKADFRLPAGAPFGHSPTMVFYFQTNLVCVPRNSDDCIAAAGVPMNVGKRLLQNTEYRDLHFPGQPAETCADVHHS